MPSNDNVISFGSRKPLSVEEAEKKEAEVAAAVERDNAIVTHSETNAKILNNALELVEADKLEGVIVIGRDPKTKYFFTELGFERAVIPNHDLYAYIGLLETLKLELIDGAQMAPSVVANGEIVDPHAIAMAAEEDFE